MDTLSKEQFFIEATSRFCSSLDITVSLGRLREYLKTVMPVDHLALDVYKPELKSIRSVAVAMESESIWLDDLIPVHDKTAQFIEEELKNQPIVINDVASDENLGPMLNFVPRKVNPWHEGKVSIIGLPLTIEGKWIGNFAIVALGLNKFSEDYAEMLTPLREPFALVMSNCLQYKEILRLQDMLADENRYLQQELREAAGDVIGKNFGLKDVMEMVTQTAPKDAEVPRNLRALSKCL